MKDGFNLELDNLARDLDSIKTEMSSFVQTDIAEMIALCPFVVKTSREISFSPGNEKIAFKFNPRAIAKSGHQHSGNVVVSFCVLQEWVNRNWYRKAYDTPSIVVPKENFDFDEDNMVSRELIDQDEASELKRRAAEDNRELVQYRQDLADAAQKQAEKAKTKNKKTPRTSSANKFFQSLASSSKKIPVGIDGEASESTEMVIENEMSSEIGDSSSAKRSRFERDPILTPTPFEENGVLESSARHRSEHISSVGATSLDFDSTPIGKFTFKRGKVKVVDDDDNSIDEGNRKPKNKKQKEKPPITVADCKIYAKKSFITTCLTTREITATMEKQIELNKHRMDEAIENAPPTGRDNFLYWARKENSKADNELLDFILRFVRNEQMQMELEERLINFILRKHELHHLTTCSDLSPGQYVVCTNLVEITTTLKKQIMQTMSDMVDLEKMELEKLCRQRIKQYEDNLDAECEGDMLVSKSELLGLFRAEATKQMNCAITLIVSRNSGMSSRINVSITRVLTRVTMAWARVTENVDQIPPELGAMYAKLSNAPGFQVIEDMEQRDAKLMDCIKKSLHDKKQMQNLMVQIVNKDARANFQENYTQENAAKKSKSSSASSAKKASGDEETTSSAVAKNGETAVVAASTKQQLTLDQFVASNPDFGSAFLAYSAVATPSSASHLAVETVSSLARGEKSPPRIHFKTPKSIENMDEVMKIIIRVSGYGKHDNVYLGFDASGGKKENTLVRLKLIKFLFMVMEEENYCEHEELRVIFQQHAPVKDVSCIFCFKHSSEDRLTIKPDGYCFYRMVFQLWRRHKSEYTLSLADMVDNDRKVNSSAISTPENEEFKKFLLNLQEHIRPLDGSEDAYQVADRHALVEAFELAAAYCSIKPGKSIAEEDWGNSAWLKFFLFNISNFTAVKNDNNFLARRLYELGEVGDQWSLMQRPGLCDPKKQGFSYVDVYKGIQTPNFCSYSSSHFFVIDNPSATNVNASTNKALEIALTKMLHTLTLLKVNYKVAADDVGKMINWLESGCDKNSLPQVATVNLDEFKRNVAVDFPGVNQASSSVIDLSIDDDLETVQLDKSNDDIVIEMLTKLVCFLVKFRV